MAEQPRSNRTLRFRAVTFLSSAASFDEKEIPKDVEIIGVAGDTRSAVDLIRELNADAVIVEAQFEQSNGVEICRILRSHCRNIIVLVSKYNAVKYANQLHRCGVSAICLNNPSRKVLTEAFGSIRFGRFYLEPAIQQGIVQLPSKNPVAAHDFSERELIVIARLDLPDEAIARELGITKELVSDEIRSICTKMNVPTRTSAAMRAVQLGLFEKQECCDSLATWA